MFRFLKASGGTLCDRVTRREFLEIGGSGLLGLSLADLLRAGAAASGESRRTQAPPARSCIILFLAGGPSHLDMWDLKPEAPAEIRGEFQPIPTDLPGVTLCEHLPRLAQTMGRVTLVRSMHHEVSVAHWAATYYALTGHNQGDSNTAEGPKPGDHPSIGSVVSRLRPPDRPVVPYVSLPYITSDVPGDPPQKGVYGGWLGRAWDPLFVLRDPNAADFGVPELTLSSDVSLERLSSRRGLLEQIEERLPSFEQTAATADLGGFYERAFSILTSPETRRAFDIRREPDRLRDAYGRNIYGQSLLLSRRLIEAGTRLITLKWGPDVLSTWDTHKNNFEKLRGELLPQLDACLPALLADLDDRGLLDETLVVVMGEFGRTPRIGTVNANALTDTTGRDHWPYCYSLLLAGGGIARGRVIGRSDRIGAHPLDSAATPHDLVATIYTLLGLPPDTELVDPLDRPLRLVEGHVMTDVLG